MAKLFKSVALDLMAGVHPPPRRVADEERLQRRMGLMNSFAYHWPMDYLFHLTEFTPSNNLL
jgi:hypothetical protein